MPCLNHETSCATRAHSLKLFASLANSEPARRPRLWISFFSGAQGQGEESLRRGLCSGLCRRMSLEWNSVLLSRPALWIRDLWTAVEAPNRCGLPIFRSLCPSRLASSASVPQSMARSLLLSLSLSLVSLCNGWRCHTRVHLLHSSMYNIPRRDLSFVPQALGVVLRYFIRRLKAESWRRWRGHTRPGTAPHTPERQRRAPSVQRKAAQSPGKF